MLRDSGGPSTQIFMAMYSVVCVACLKISHLQRVKSYFLNKDSLIFFSI